MTTHIRKSILVFSFFPANFPPTSGGEQRLHSLYSAVSAHHDVVMLSSAAVVGEVERIVHNSNFVEYRVPKGEGFYQLWSDLERLQGYGDLSAIAIALMGETGTKLHELYLEHYAAADVIVHQFPFTLPYDLFWKLDDKPRVYSSENAEHVLYANMYSDEAVSDVGDYVRDLEAALVQDADLIGYCSEIDIEAIKSLAPVKDEQTVFLPNGVLLGKPAVARKHRKKATRFLFLGSRHKPNQEAARFIVDELAPRLPALAFDITGECLPEGDYPANVTRHGFVSDAQLAALCASCDAAINPMTSGSGSNVKVFEFVRQDLPIVSTHFGMRGVAAVPGRDYVESSIANFADTLDALSRDASALGGMAGSIRASVAVNHDWRSIGERFASRISRLERKAGAPMGGHVLALNDYDVARAIGGGATRFRGNFGAVAARAPVLALCFSDDDRLSYTRTDEGVHVIAVPKTREHRDDEASANVRFYISVTDVLSARHVLDNPLMGKLYDVLRKDACRIVTEHPFMAPLPVARGDRFIYSSQNDESLLKAGLFEYHPDRDDLMALVRSVEGAAVERADLVVTVSDEDRRSLSFGRATLPPMVTVRNGVPAAKPPRALGTGDKRAEEWVAVFIGSGHAPNYIAARYIVDHLAPACPDVIFTFIGSVCESLVDQPPPNIRLLGRLSDEDKSAVLWGASCALNSMANGSGSNVKLAEYFAHGLPVLTTPFGVRGYPPEVAAVCVVEPLSEFPRALNALRKAEAESRDATAKRLRIFDEALSAERLGAEFADVILPRAPIQRRALFVTYRWNDPDLGGSEAAMRRYINHLAEQPGVAVDVVSTDIKGIASHHRFGGRYTVEPTAAPTGAIDIRARRFAIDPSPSPQEKAMLERVWEAQGEFEKTWISALGHRLRDPALAWGWYDHETWSDGTVRRWSSGDSAIHLGKGGGKVRLSGVAPHSLGLALLTGDETPLWTGRLGGDFEIELDVESDWLLLRAAVPARPQVDPRALAFAVDAVLIDGLEVPFDLTAANRLQADDPEGLYTVLADAARATRSRRGAELTSLRGPRSERLERWLQDNVGDYDLVITHNPTFYPTTLAVRLATEAGVPSVMVPHVHLDDDYYHFPDVIEAITGATLNLVCPQSAADFLAAAGAAVASLTPGVDIDETFTEADEKAFLDAGGPGGRFVLVLGRKAGAKNYKDVIAAVDALAVGQDIKVVLIGPDDDGEPIVSPNALYMGRQPREVVRGALRRAAALVNMSSSESFGIVILEAWMAGCPVIVRRASSAFRELVQHGHTGLLADPSTLRADIEALLADPSAARRMARAGEIAVRDYDWSAIGQRFADACLALMTRGVEA